MGGACSIDRMAAAQPPLAALSALPAAGEIAQAELDRDADADSANAKHGARHQECPDGARTRVSQLVIARSVKRPGDLPIRHPSRVACRRAIHRNMPGMALARTM